MAKVKHVYIFTTRGSDKLSKAIALGSAPLSWLPQLKNVASHAGLMFEMDSGKKFYFESHTPDGWKGPKPIKRLEEWAAKDPKAWVRYRELDLSQSEKDSIWFKCNDKLMDPAWMDYREFQILEMLARRLFRSRVSQSPSPVCSEAVAKILFPVYDLRLWAGKKPISFDEITPWRLQVMPLVRVDSWL